MFDLIGATADLYADKRDGTQGQPAVPRHDPVQSPFTEGTMSSDLPKLMENTTTSTEQTIQGRININQAPRAVLLCIPGMTSDIADQIIAKRIEDPKDDSQDHHYETWPLTEGIVPLKTMKKPVAVHYGRRQRLSGPNSGHFRGRGDDREARSHPRC